MNNTIDGDAVMQQVQQGTAPSYWRVFPAKLSHFIWSVLGYAVGALLLLGFIGFLNITPGFAISFGSSSDAPSAIQFWRTVDFVVAGVLAFCCVALFVVSIRSISSVKQQALVLLPEGFVMQKGAGKKTMTVIHFGAITGVGTSVFSGTWSLVMPRTNGKGTIKVELDGRFGAPKNIATILQAAHMQYANSRATH